MYKLISLDMLKFTHAQVKIVFGFDLTGFGFLKNISLVFINRFHLKQFTWFICIVDSSIYIVWFIMFRNLL